MKIIFSIILTFYSISASSQIARLCEISAGEVRQYAERRDKGEAKAKMISELIAWGEEKKKAFKSHTEMINDMVDDGTDRIIWVFQSSNLKSSPNKLYDIKFDLCMKYARALEGK